MTSDTIAAGNTIVPPQNDDICIICNKRMRYCKNFSIHEVLPESDPPIKLYEALKLLSNFVQLNHEQCPLHACGSCFRKAVQAHSFQRMCNKSVEYLSSCMPHLEDNKQLIHEYSADDTIITVNQDNHEAIEDLKDTAQLLSVKIDEISSTNNVENDDDGDEDSVGIDDPEDLEAEFSSESEELSSEDSDFESSKKKRKKQSNTRRPKKEKLQDNRKCRAECEFCHKTFRTDYLPVHKRIHTGETPYTCKICGKKFKCSFECNKHIKVRHNDNCPFLCPICGKGFKLNALLIAHSIIHEQGKFICDICGKSFRRKFQRQEHYVTHTGDKPFLCDECPKRFGTRKHLKQHQVIHAKVKPIQCEFCGRRFTQRHALRSHVVKSCKGKANHEEFSSSAMTTNLQMPVD